MDLDEPVTPQAIREVALILPRGRQSPESMDIRLAIEIGHAEVKYWPDNENGFPGLGLMPQGPRPLPRG